MYRVDLLSLDIEGAEQKVLETIPWDKVDIGMVMIEVGSHWTILIPDSCTITTNYVTTGRTL